MLIFLAIAVGLMGLWMLVNSVLPLVETAVVTADDWARLEDESMDLLRRRDLLIAELRDLEFEAALNKISEKDLAVLRQRYEAEAVDLVRQLDAEADTYGERIDAEVQARLDRAKAAASGPVIPPVDEVPEAPEPSTPPEPAAEAPEPSAPPEPAEAVAIDCTQCSAALPRDARFCDACGAAALVPCGGCQTPNRPEARYCKGCGLGLQEVEA